MDSFQTQRPGRGLHLPNNVPNNKNEELITATFDLLDKVEKEIKLDDSNKDIVLIIGDPGSGRNLLEWVAGENVKLLSFENLDTGEYITEDGNRNSELSKKSESNFPELVVDTTPNIAYFDSSVIMVTGRSEINQIATAYFTKKVLDHSENIKIIFTVSYSSVTKGEDIQSFLQSVRRLTEFVKDIEKFRNSIAMVVMEVHSQYSKSGSSSLLVDENAMEQAIANFLQEVKQFCEEKLEIPDMSEEERKYYASAKVFIDGILDIKDEIYVKIGILQMPDEPRRAGNISLQQEGGNKFERILNGNLLYTRKDRDDFNYSVFKKSENEMAELVREINSNVWFYFNEVSQQILRYYTDLTELMSSQIKSLTRDIFLDDLSLSETERISAELNTCFNLMSDLTEIIENSTDSEDLISKVNNIVTSVGIKVPNESAMNVVRHGKYLKFLSSASGIELKGRTWKDLQRNTLTNLGESRKVIQGEIREAAEKLNLRIVSNLKEIAKAIQDQYNSKMKSEDTEKLSDKLATEYSSMTRMIEVIGNTTTTKELVRTIHDSSNMLHIINPKENMLDITNQGRYLKFLNNISQKELEIESSAWINPFESVAKYLQQSQKWYTFLNALFDKFSEYEMQKNRHMYNVADLDDWGKAEKPQGITVTATSFNEFLNRITKYNITEQESVRNIALTDLQLDELNHILKLTLKHRINIKCENTSLIIIGSYVSITEALATVSENIEHNKSCSDLKKFTNYKIFASNTIFIDFHLPLSLFGGQFLSIIAPKWEILQQSGFDISGSQGLSHKEPVFLFWGGKRLKAANGSRPGAKGADGRPGGPGGPGGNFFGIGDTFVNGENLIITVNGGNGGTAEHGGDGYSGNNGRSPEIPSHRTRCQQSCSEIDGFKCQTISYDFKKGRCVGFGMLRKCTSDEYYCKCKIFGKPGEKGDGGNGGRRGKGGFPGNIALFELGGASGIVKVANRGKDGEDGDGGKEGSNGSHGDDIIVSFDSKVSWQWKLEERIKRPSGKKGVDGGNTVGLLDPKPPKVLKEPAKIVNEYKSYLRENMEDRFTRIRHAEFLDKMNSNNQIKSTYDTTGFIDEFEGLERQFHSLSKDVDFVPFYQSLLPRISEYAKSPKDDEKSSQHKKVLNFLYTTVLGRIYNLKDDSGSNLIVSIRGYLDIVKAEIGNLKDLQNVNNKAGIISKYQERYKNNLDRKIEEAKHIIEKQITPEMGNISKAIDKKIDLLIEETIELQRKAEKDKDAMIKKKQELEKAMALRGLFSCISIFGQVLSFFGPVGTIAGSVIGATSSVTESLALETEKKTLQIPPSVLSNLKTIGKQIKSLREKKLTHLDKLLEEISQEVVKNPETLGDMSERINNLRDRLIDMDEKTYDFKEIKKIESELEKELKNKEGQLKIKGVEPNDKTKGALKVVEKVSQAIKFGSLLVDIYNKHKSDQEKVDTITDAIEETEDKIRKLKAYEEQIYETIIPTLQNMENSLQEVVSKMEAKSQVSLEVTKWKVQTALRDMKLQMQQFTEGFQIKDNLARCIEQLEEVMTTLINVYDRIQNYQDQQNLANYIADISSASANSINISNPNLAKAVNHLEMLIRSNVVLTQYKAAVNAFKQWVFPFANDYLEESMLPSHLELEKNIENLVDSAVKQIEIIKSKLDLYKTSVKKSDKYIHTGEFSSRYVSTEPFYVWKNDEFRDAISKLLSGQEVLLRADVKGSAVDKDAIKFSVVELHFKTSNETLQSEINNVIKGFDLKAVHHGNSHYRYADRIYVITSDSQTISFSCEKNTAGEPVRKNTVFDKIKEGDLMLSPYTLWEMKMINATRKFSFRDLEIYKDYVDVELSGYGSYVPRNANGLKFADKEYRSLGEFDEVDVCIESEARNSSKCSDLIGRMIRSTHHVTEHDGYVSNGAAPNLWSPLNYACSFLKMHVVSSFVQFFIDEVKITNVDTNDEISVKRSSGISKRQIKTGESNAGGIEVERREIIKGHENCKRNLIFSPSGSCSFSDRSDLKKAFLPSGSEDVKSRYFSQYFEVNCTLLLADLVTRTITENKYKQAVDECLLSSPQKLEIKLENCVIRDEDDVRCHLHNLSRMTDDKENYSLLDQIKSYAKSIFQYFELDKKSEPDFVEDVRFLFV